MDLEEARAYSNLFFAPRSLQEFIHTPRMRINEKDQDFAIYRSVRVRADGEEKLIKVPVVSIECKTYIDKTMLEGSIATAEKIKMGNPYCLFVVVTEWYDVSYEVDPKYSRIDQIYVLRRSKRREESSQPIDPDVVLDLFGFVHEHLTRDWSSIEEKMRREGKIL
ncbi:MAG TPA: Bpu10I family restriction endonuclease [Chloroflexi bacterium]|nr:Bpu10I family restriction endonuclease [Chloroflexota bacterium]